MDSQDFKRLVGLAQTELGVRRIMLWHGHQVTGSTEEILDAGAFAEHRAEQLLAAEQPQLEEAFA